MIEKGNKIFVKSSKDFRGVVLSELINLFSEKAPVEIVKSKTKTDKIAVADTTDLIAYRVINSVIRGDAGDLKENSPINGKMIRLLYLFLDKEILLYAKLKKLKFKKKAEKKNKLDKFVDNLEKKHPEVKRAVVNSYLGLK